MDQLAAAAAAAAFWQQQRHYHQQGQQQGEQQHAAAAAAAVVAETIPAQHAWKGPKISVVAASKLLGFSSSLQPHARQAGTGAPGGIVESKAGQVVHNGSSAGRQEPAGRQGEPRPKPRLQSIRGSPASQATRCTRMHSPRQPRNPAAQPRDLSLERHKHGGGLDCTIPLRDCMALQRLAAKHQPCACRVGR